MVACAGVAERLGSGLQSRTHGFESRHSLRESRIDGAVALPLVVRGAGQVDGVLVHEVARPRITAPACAVGITGTLDP